MFKRPILWLVFGLTAVCLLCGLLYFLPPVHARLAWRVENLRVAIRRALNPPEQVVFVPQARQALNSRSTECQSATQRRC